MAVSKPEIETIPGFRGIVRTDEEALAVYSEAADISRIIPKMIAVPADAEDVVTLVRWANENNMPITARGSGSSMGGGAIGSGVILDMSQMNWINDVDKAGKSIRVGPGAIRDEVENRARDEGLRFPPDPSSGRFCTIGGMVSTNAAGSHTLKFGATRNWVRSLDCVFADGSRATVRRGDKGWREISALEPLQKALPRLSELSNQAPLKKPGLFKESSGYAVSEFLLNDDPVDLLAGSEGTLAIIVGIELVLTEAAQATSSVLGTFSSLDDATEAAILARNFGAVACELLDRTYLDIVRSTTELPNIPQDTEAVLLAEVEGTSVQQAQNLASAFRSNRATSVSIALSAAEEYEMWEIRHAASPTLSTLGPSLTSMQFIEDCGVPPEHFPEFIRGIREIFRIHDVSGVIFGHAGDCHAHVNPLIDVGKPNWEKKVASILDMTVELTARLGGTLAAEHGDGRLRAPLLDRVWPEQALEAFRLVKDSFDPKNILNPGVKIPLAGQNPLGMIKYDPQLPALPEKARKALKYVTSNRAYNQHRLDLLDSAT